MEDILDEVRLLQRGKHLGQCLDLYERIYYHCIMISWLYAAKNHALTSIQM